MKPTSTIPSGIPGAIFMFIASLAAAQLPPLNVHTVGEYGFCPWQGLDPSGAPPEPPTRLYRVKDLNFTIRNIWVRDEETVEKLDLSSVLGEIEEGWKFTPKRAMLVRIDFWGGRATATGAERYEGHLQPLEVYRKRVAAVLNQLEPALNKIQGICLSEENTPFGGRAQVLQGLYDHFKKKYPTLRIFQWWTPDTSVPCRHDGALLSADGWVIDPYGLTPSRYPQGPSIKRLIQKYLVTGKPLIFVAPASNLKGLQHTFPAVLQEHLQACYNFNLPVAFYWCYQKDEKSGDTTLFGHPTGNELMDRINEEVFAWIKRAQSTPGDYTGKTEVADTWENPPLKVRVKSGLALLKDDFTESRFLDECSGHGFRDIAWTGDRLVARGYRGRKTSAFMLYKIQGSDPIPFPQASLQTETDPALKGLVRLSFSKDGGQTWPVTAQTPGNGGRHELSARTADRSDFGEVREVWLKVEMKGDAGTMEQPPVRVDNLAVRAGAKPAFDDSAIITDFLDVDFESNYKEGPVEGQSGGSNGGAWRAESGRFEVQRDIAQGGKGLALSSSRTGSGQATIALLKLLEPTLPKIYFAVDVYRGANKDQGCWTLKNNKSGNNCGLGFSIGAGAGPVLRYLTGGKFEGKDSDFTVDNEIWHRFEIEADGVSKKYNLYAQVEGKPGRILVAKDVAWEAPNAYVQEFMIYPYGQGESVMITDNIVVWSVTDFPVNRPLSK
ncbi:MAG: hypothetical protein HY360_12085 [Verrucomicrobia bacterium]|nr:hypothetical protein [Verrucomicrobiota bacterium]